MTDQSLADEAKTEYEGKHRPETRPKRLDLGAYASIMAKLASALRGVPNDSPRHARTSHQTYQPCVINSAGRCTRMTHSHEDES